MVHNDVQPRMHRSGEEKRSRGRRQRKPKRMIQVSTDFYDFSLRSHTVRLLQADYTLQACLFLHVRERLCTQQVQSRPRSQTARPLTMKRQEEQSKCRSMLLPRRPPWNGRTG